MDSLSANIVFALVLFDFFGDCSEELLFYIKSTLIPLPYLALVSLKKALMDCAYYLASLKGTSSSSVLSTLLPTTASTLS